MPRSVEERIRAMRMMRPPRRGLCARTVWLSLGVPPLGAPSATAAANRIQNSGHLHTVTRPEDSPRGAVMLWRGGSQGYGHAALSLGYVNGTHRTLTVDAMGKPVADVPTSWIKNNWRSLRWAGWTSWWGRELPMYTPIKSSEEKTVVDAWAVGESRKVELESKNVVEGQYTTLATIDLPKGRYQLSLQVRLPADSRGRMQYKRVNWGSGVTGNDPLVPPDDEATSYTRAGHQIAGGGPLAYQVKVYGGDRVTSVVCKALRIA